MTHVGDPQKLYPTQFTGPTKLLFHKNGLSWLLNPIKQATVSPSSSQIRLTAWLHLGISRPGTSSSHLIQLYSSTVKQGAPGKTQMGPDLGLYHLGNPRVNAPNGQLETMSEHHHPVPAQLILHRGWQLLVSGHSQPLQPTGLGKSLPLICQQQSRLNYNRRVY